jgi:hypothetical protein
VEGCVQAEWRQEFEDGSGTHEAQRLIAFTDASVAMALTVRILPPSREFFIGSLLVSSWSFQFVESITAILLIDTTLDVLVIVLALFVSVTYPRLDYLSLIVLLVSPSIMRVVL